MHLFLHFANFCCSFTTVHMLFRCHLTISSRVQSFGECLVQFASADFRFPFFGLSGLIHSLVAFSFSLHAMSYTYYIHIFVSWLKLFLLFFLRVICYTLLKYNLMANLIATKISCLPKNTQKSTCKIILALLLLQKWHIWDIFFLIQIFTIGLCLSLTSRIHFCMVILIATWETFWICCSRGVIWLKVIIPCTVWAVLNYHPKFGMT